MGYRVRRARVFARAPDHQPANASASNSSAASLQKGKAAIHLDAPELDMEEANPIAVAAAMLDEEMLRLAQQHMGRMSAVDLARMQHQLMSNPYLIKLVLQSMKNMQPDDLRRAAMQFSQARLEDICNMTEKIFMEAQTDCETQKLYTISGVKRFKKQGNEFENHVYSDVAKYKLAKDSLKSLTASAVRNLELQCSIILMACYLEVGKCNESITRGSYETSQRSKRNIFQCENDCEGDAPITDKLCKIFSSGPDERCSASCPIHFPPEEMRQRAKHNSFQCENDFEVDASITDKLCKTFSSGPGLRCGAFCPFHFPPEGDNGSPVERRKCRLSETGRSLDNLIHEHFPWFLKVYLGNSEVFDGDIETLNFLRSIAAHCDPCLPGCLRKAMVKIHLKVKLKSNKQDKEKKWHCPFSPPEEAITCMQLLLAEQRTLQDVLADSADKFESWILPQELRNSKKPPTRATFLSDYSRRIIRELLICVCRRGHGVLNITWGGKFDLKDILVSTGGIITISSDVPYREYDEAGGEDDYKKLYQIIEDCYNKAVDGVYPAYLENLLHEITLMRRTRENKRVTLLVNHPALQSYGNRCKIYLLIDKMIHKLASQKVIHELLFLDEYASWPAEIMFIPDLKKTYDKTHYGWCLQAAFHFCRNYLSHYETISLKNAEAALAVHLPWLLPKVIKIAALHFQCDLIQWDPVTVIEIY